MSQNRKQLVLIVEDHAEQLTRITELFSETEYEPLGVPSFEAALKSLSTLPISILLTDIHLKKGQEQNSFEGLKLLEFVEKNYPEILCLAMSSDPKITTYEKALKLGAKHYLRKPIFSADELKIAINLSRSRKINELALKYAVNLELEKHVLAKCPDGVVLPTKIRDLCKAVAMSKKVSVIIKGETGTGKEVVANLIHRNRVEFEGALPFIAVNCATLNPDLAVSVLFGHKKGSFTGADATTNGLIGDADGGILFLDEIHTLTIPLQQKLLRVLNDGCYERLGESKSLYSSFQVITASTKDLDCEVDAGRFLLDLRTRLTGIDISLKPLRERLEDIELLVPIILAKEKARISALELDKLIQKCKQYYWGGNIRQLQKILQIFVVMGGMSGAELNAEELPVHKSMLKPGDLETASVQGIPADYLKTISTPLLEDAPISETMEKYEKLVIQAALDRHKKTAQVVEALSIPRTTLDNRIKKYGLD